MSKIIIQGNDEYIVQLESIVSNYDRKILTRLYQPIIGASSFALYLTLLSELEFDKTVTALRHPFESVSKMTGLQIDDLRLCFSKLEGSGLIKLSKHKKDNYFLIKMYSPLEPSNFYSNSALDTKLLKKLGKLEYDKTKQYFTFATINEDDFDDVTDTFEEAFEHDNESSIKSIGNQAKKNSQNVKVSSDKSALLLKLKEMQISSKNISEHSFEIIESYCSSYNISQVDMAKIIAKSLNSSGDVDVERLRKYSESFINGKEIKLSDIKNKIVDYGSPKLNELINMYNSYSPTSFLTLKNAGAPLLTQDINLLNTLTNIYGFVNGVINCLVDYVLHRNENKLSKPYVETIATSLKRSKINDTLSCYNYLYKKTVAKPQVEESKKNSKVATQKDINEALKMLEEIRSKRRNENK